MKLLYGTGNQAKLSAMRSRLSKLGIELIGLSDLRAEGKTIPKVTEDGNSPLENARIKAEAYYKAFQIPVFSCDSGLYFDEVSDEVQPGVHVRNVAGKCLSDEEMLKYYASLAKAYGNLTAQYRNAICFVVDEEHVYESMVPSMYSEKFILTDRPHSAIRKKGFPLDSLSIDRKTGKYYYDLAEGELDQLAVEDGFLKFFEEVLGQEEKTRKCKLLLFDLDGTLLQTDKTISKRTMCQLERCREQGMMIGVSTSRSEQNCLGFIGELHPDIVISSAGALVKYHDTYIYKAEFTREETKNLIEIARNICGQECEITVDTIDAHYWNYKIDPKQADKSWGDTIYTDFCDFDQASLKICVEIFDEKTARRLQDELPDCDCMRFSDGCWYKFTRKNATKEDAILQVCEACSITPEEIIAFGDDYADIGMLKLCGVGVAMGNAIDEVKSVADRVIGDNDHEGIAVYLESAGL